MSTLISKDWKLPVLSSKIIISTDVDWNSSENRKVLDKMVAILSKRNSRVITES